MKNKLKKLIFKLKKTGFFSIFLSSVFSKVIVFFGGILVVRILSKNDYGVYAYIINCLSVMRLLNDFGASSAILQYATESSNNVDKQYSYVRYGFRIAIYASLLSSVIILLSPLYYPYTIKGADRLTSYLFLVPIFATFSEIFPVIFRFKLENKKYGILQIFITICHYFCIIIMSLLFGLIGTIFSQYLYYIIIIVFSMYLCRNYLKKLTKSKGELANKEKKNFIKYAFTTQINSTIGGLLLIIDTFLIGLLISSEESLATYNVASKIPHALSFLPTCVAIYILPHFIRNNNNMKWVKKNYYKILKIGIIFYGFVCLGLIAFSKPIFYIAFGKEYFDSIPIFIVLIIGFFFYSIFKIPSMNILSSMKKLKFNFYVNVFSIIINIISNIYFINKFGIIGAAITTTLINILSSLAYYVYLNIIFKKEKIR